VPSGSAVATARSDTGAGTRPVIDDDALARVAEVLRDPLPRTSTGDPGVNGTTSLIGRSG
jgi:hypothetical protein